MFAQLDTTTAEQLTMLLMKAGNAPVLPLSPISASFRRDNAIVIAEVTATKYALRRSPVVY